jgi:hypothetical protein
MIRRLAEQRGVAAITVLMVTAVTALAGATVLFTATAELDIGARDRRAEDAFAASEAGLDQASAWLFENPTFSDVPLDPVLGTRRKCLNNPLVVATPDLPCEVSITSPSNGELFFPPDGGKPYILYDVLSQAREGRAATRALASRFRLDPKDIPYGMFINGNVDLNGGPQLLRISMLVNGVVTSRDKIDTDADGDGNGFNDPDLGWRFHSNRIQSNPGPNTTCSDPSLPGQQVGCVAVYSNFQIYRKNLVKESDEIHSCNPACFPNDRDAAHQAKIIPPPPEPGGVAQPVVSLPDTDILEAMEGLKQLAQAQGNYVTQKDGSNSNIVVQPATIGAPAKNFAKNAVFYIDADAGDQIKWRPSLTPDSPDSDVRYINSAGQKVGSQSGIIVVRGGQLDIEAGTEWSGALFAPENKVRLLGTNTCTCTIYAKGFEKVGGNAAVQLVPEWFTRLPAGFVSVRRQSFAECEPYQESALCPAA